MKRTLLTTLVAATLGAGAADAQTLYRCGNTYSQTPCAADAASARVPSSAAPDPASGTAGQELCATDGLAQLAFPDPESTRIRSVNRAGTEVIQYAGKSVVARRYNLLVNTRNVQGAYTGERVYPCYLSEDERRVLKVGSR
jgi:hypothetical protein